MAASVLWVHLIHLTKTDDEPENFGEIWGGMGAMIRQTLRAGQWAGSLTEVIRGEG